MEEGSFNPDVGYGLLLLVPLPLLDLALATVQRSGSAGEGSLLVPRVVDTCPDVVEDVLSSLGHHPSLGAFW